MGHANVSNLSGFFVNRLYAKGSLSIGDCIEALVKAGEKLQASEGAYEDDYMLHMAVQQIVHYLTRVDPTQHGYSGPRGGGPWIVADFSPWPPGPRNRLSTDLRRLLQDCAAASEDVALHAIVGDKLEEEGLDTWAAHVRELPRQREVYRQWQEEEDSEWDYAEGGEGPIFDRIRWRFAPGWRKRYRDVPILSNITN